MSRNYVSAADLSDSEHLIAAGDANGLAVLATAASDDLLGAIKDGGRVSGDGISVFDPKCPVGYVKLGGNVNEFARLTSNGSSKAVATTTATDQVFGRALQAGVANDVIQFEPIPGSFGA